MLKSKTFLVLLSAALLLLTACTSPAGNSTKGPDPAPPSGPSDFSASVRNATVILSWAASSGAASYNLYWSTTSGVTTANGTKISNVTSPYAKVNLNNGTTYYYIATSVTAGSESPASTQVGATPVATVTTLAGGGSPGGTDPGHADGTGTAATLFYHRGVTVDSSGNLYVADTNNSLIRKITPSGVVTTLAGGGTPGGTTQGHADGSGTAATFHTPMGITVDSSGNLYVTEFSNNLIRKITPSGVVTTLAGGGSPGGITPGNADGTGTAATFRYPRGITVDSSGNLYVADTNNNLIRKITPSGVVTTLAGGGSPGGIDPGHADGTGTAATFYGPEGIVVDSSGNLYVGDPGNNLIRKITPSGVVTTLAGGGSPGGIAATFDFPTAIAVDSSGNLYIADTNNNLIRKITPSAVVTTLAGGGSPGGISRGNADGTGTAATFKSPYGIAVDSSENLYVADTGNSLIRKIY